MDENINQQNEIKIKSSTNWAKSLIFSLMMMIMAFVLTSLLIYYGTKGAELEGGIIALGIIIVVFLPLFFGGIVVFFISFEKYYKYKKIEAQLLDNSQSIEMPQKKDFITKISYFIVALSIIVWIIVLFLIFTPT